MASLDKQQSHRQNDIGGIVVYWGKNGRANKGSPICLTSQSVGVQVICYAKRINTAGRPNLEGCQPDELNYQSYPPRKTLRFELHRLPYQYLVVYIQHIATFHIHLVGVRMFFEGVARIAHRPHVIPFSLFRILIGLNLILSVLFFICVLQFI